MQRPAGLEIGSSAKRSEQSFGIDCLSLLFQFLYCHPSQSHPDILDQKYVWILGLGTAVSGIFGYGRRSD